VLTSKTLLVIRDEILKRDDAFNGQIVVYGESSRIGKTRLKREGVVFKQMPYEVKSR
jgi:adenine-specific DNA-methyltransferase